MKIVDAINSSLSIGQILVVDGGSTDRTASVARNSGAKVLENPFQYAAQQYNFGIDRVETPWCFILDSDESIDTVLRDAIRNADSDADAAGFEVKRQNYFSEKPVRHSGWSPDWNVRLLRVGKAAYEDRPVHARVVTEGPVGRLEGLIHHYTYDGVSHYLRKLDRFTSREVEARQLPQHSVDSRSRLRRLYLMLPGRPFIRFVYMFIVRAGFRDGQLGFDIAILSAFYEHIVGLKRRYDYGNK